MGSWDIALLSGWLVVRYNSRAMASENTPAWITAVAHISVSAFAIFHINKRPKIPAKKKHTLRAVSRGWRLYLNSRAGANHEQRLAEPEIVETYALDAMGEFEGDGVKERRPEEGRRETTGASSYLYQDELR